MEFEIVELRQQPQLRDCAAAWFHEKWRIPAAAYRESMEESLSSTDPVPRWYLALRDGIIAGGLGVIENDFHPRRDLTPNICAVFVEPVFRRRGLARALLCRACNDLAAAEIRTVYLLTDHTGFYERCGWQYLCSVPGDGDAAPGRIYVHQQEA